MALAGRTGIAKSLTARPLWAPDRCRAIYRKGASQNIRGVTIGMSPSVFSSGLSLASGNLLRTTDESQGYVVLSQ
jgi:hypothetical protein